MVYYCGEQTIIPLNRKGDIVFRAPGSGNLYSESTTCEEDVNKTELAYDGESNLKSSINYTNKLFFESCVTNNSKTKKKGNSFNNCLKVDNNFDYQCSLTTYQPLYRLPRSPTARAAIMLYPFPPVPFNYLPELRNPYHRSLFLQYAKIESNLLKVQLAHFVIEYCSRSLPENLFRSNNNYSICVIDNYVHQILYAVQIFKSISFQSNELIPTDINEVYISNWLKEKEYLLRPLEALNRLNHDEKKTAGSIHGKNIRRIGVSQSEKLFALGIPKAIHFDNLIYAIANRGIIVQLPLHIENHSMKSQDELAHSQIISEHKFNLLVTGRGDTRKSKLTLPWGEIVNIKYNRTLLGIPDFVLKAYKYSHEINNGIKSNLQSLTLIPKVCAVSLENPFYGIEILLFYKGMSCSKKKRSITNQIQNQECFCTRKIGIINESQQCCQQNILKKKKADNFIEDKNPPILLSGTKTRNFSNIYPCVIDHNKSNLTRVFDCSNDTMNSSHSIKQIETSKIKDNLISDQISFMCEKLDESFLFTPSPLKESQNELINENYISNSL